MFSKNLFLYTLLVVSTLLLSYLFAEVLNIYNLTLNSLAEQITREELQELIGVREKWKWIGGSFRSHY